MPRPASTELDRVRLALERAQRVLWESQRADGSWDSPGRIGPWLTAQVVVVLHHLNELSADEARACIRWLVSQQRADGGFVLHPFAREGELGATACAWAALHVTNFPEHAEALRKAKAFVERGGGLQRVISRMDEGDFAAIFLAMAGLLEARQLPRPITLPLLAEPVVELLQTRFHAGVTMGALQLDVLVRRLRGDWGPDGSRKGPLDRALCHALVREVGEFQNDNGSWNDSVGMTVFALAALAAAGLAPDNPMRARALCWVKAQRTSTAGAGSTFDGFGAEVWSTAFNARALMTGGICPSDPDVQRALDWIVSAQLQVDMPRPNNRKPDAIRRGGWAFQRTNHTMPDCDDAGVCLSTLGQALSWKGPGELDSASRARLQRSVTQGREWLLGMQNPDGGWSAFVWGLPPKTPGPVLTKTPVVRLDDPLSMARALVDPPVTTGDPSTEDLTARVLHGLGALGMTIADEPVHRAVEFLRRQQCSDGSFWGRWVVNHLAGTAFVLMGLRAVGADLRAPWVRHAVRFVLSKQNADGGFGETERTYREPHTAGTGPSMPPLTGLVLQGLIEAGEGDGEAVQRGVAYLLAQQRPDGTWRNGRYLHTNVPPETFYVYEEAARFYPSEALALYLAHRKGTPVARPQDRWSDALLDAMRQTADPEADAVVSSVFGHGPEAVEGVNRLLGGLFRSDEPVPPGLPPGVARHLELTGALPSWADEARIATAQRLFSRAGWEVATGLFCSALPQAYAAARGARVLTRTQAMTRHVHQRIFETAQFLFDVLDEGGLSPSGRGVRTVQKIRLLHAGIRHLLQTRPEPRWDASTFGLPINQEDLGGTLMTFSVVTLEALPSLGVGVSADEAEAWMHLWRVVGHLLGIHERMLPDGVEDGAALMEAIRRRHWAASEDGRALAAPLIEMMQGYFPGRALDGVPVAMVRHLAGDHCADLLGLPQADWTRLVIDATAELDRIFDPDERDRLGRMLSGATGMIMRGIVAAEREGKGAAFRIPTSLQRTRG